MKKIFVLLMSIAMLSCNDLKTEQNSITATDSIPIVNTAAGPGSLIKDETVIESIRRKVQKINNMRLLVQTFDYRQDGCVEEGKISFYQSNDTIVKIIESGFIGDSGWIKEYYYDDGKFIFSFMQSIGSAAAMPADTSEIREYVNSDTLVLMKRNKESHTGIQQRWNNGSTEYKLLQSFKKKDFAEVLCK